MRAGLRWLTVAGLVLGFVGATAVSAAAGPAPHVVYGVGGAITAETYGNAGLRGVPDRSDRATVAAAMLGL